MSQADLPNAGREPAKRSLGGWLRRGFSVGRRNPTSRYERPTVDGCSVLLQRLDAQAGSEVIEALAERYRVAVVDEEGLLYRVDIEDARFTDEAVVRLASSLDEIDASWESGFAWPRRID